MTINRIAAQKMIDTIPQTLRAAARKERQILLKETKKDPIAASFMAAKGELPFFNNVKLTNTISEINKKLAAEAYQQRQAQEFVQRQPMGYLNQKAPDANEVVHASMFIG